MEKKILYVDDDPDSQERMKEVLMAQGVCHIDSCFNPDEARERLKHTIYDVLIVDEFLPAEKGHEFISTIEKRPDKIYILTDADSEILGRILNAEHVSVDGIMNKGEFFKKIIGII